MYRIIRATTEDKIIDRIEITFDIEIVRNNVINSSTTTDDIFPGIAQFEKDVNDIMESLNFEVAKHWQTDNKDEGSISVYFIVYYCLSEDKHVECLTHFKVSDHTCNDYSDEGHKKYIKRTNNEFQRDSVKEFMYDEEINIGQKIYRQYSVALDEIEYELKQYISSWERKFRRKGLI